MNIEDPYELKTYLIETGRLKPNEMFESHTLSGGVSNRTVLLKRSDGRNWVLKQALEKLRVSVDWFSSPERIHREAAGMRYLYQLAPEHITSLIFEDHKEHILAMEAVIEPHQNWKEMLLRGEVDSDHVRQFAELLGIIHRVSSVDKNIDKVFADRSYFESLRLEPYYLYAAQQVPEASLFLHTLTEATRQRLYTLVHGDYSPKNILVYQRRLILLDHEVIHFGDPAFDVGFALTHFLSKAHHLVAKRGEFAEAALQFWRVYQEGIKGTKFYDDLEPFAIKHTLACLLARVAGRSQLEYLSPSEKSLQKAVVVSLMQHEPTRLPEMVSSFLKGV
jgi:5-methylthioribose kinase